MPQTFTVHPSRWAFGKYTVTFRDGELDNLLDHLYAIDANPNEIMNEFLRRLIEETLNEKFQSLTKTAVIELWSAR
jgi:hypothetical protein